MDVSLLLVGADAAGPGALSVPLTALDSGSGVARQHAFDGRMLTVRVSDSRGQADQLGAALPEPATVVESLGAPVICTVIGLHGDDDLAASLACYQRPHSLGDLAQRVSPPDEWPELAGLDQLPQDLQVLLVRLGGQHPQPLTDEP
jgi:hypothetical protein